MGYDPGGSGRKTLNFQQQTSCESSFVTDAHGLPQLGAASRILKKKFMYIREIRGEETQIDLPSRFMQEV